MNNCEVIEHIKKIEERPDLFYPHFVNNQNQDLMENISVIYFYEGYLLIDFVVNRMYKLNNHGIWGRSASEMSKADIVEMYKALNADSLPDLKIEYLDSYGNIIASLTVKNPKFERFDMSNDTIKTPLKVNAYCHDDYIGRMTTNPDISYFVYKVSYSDICF